MATNPHGLRRTTLQDLQADTERLQTEQLGAPETDPTPRLETGILLQKKLSDINLLQTHSTPSVLFFQFLETIWSKLVPRFPW